jgi:hypothetical protein
MRGWLMGLGLAAILAAPAVAQTGEVQLRPCRGGSAEDRQFCEMTRQRAPGELQKARAGDYGGQRNLAFMLSGATQPPDASAVVPNPQEACAWRLVILQSGHRQVTLVDAQNAVTDCARPGVNPVRAQARAAELHGTIRPTR